MTDQHFITPPPELVQQWWEETNHWQYTGSEAEEYVVSMAAQWGWDQRGPEIQAAADQELEACCNALNEINPDKYWSQRLRAARHPKPLSLKEQALAVLEDSNLDAAHYNILLRALEQLDD